MQYSRLFSRLRYFSRSNYCTRSNQSTSRDENFVAKQLYSKIKATGPITVADYMKEVLISPDGGYYMHKDVFGSSGDFITSPELNQMFGEMVAIWCINEWSKIGCPKPFQIVELGPGRGSLSKDILRVFNHFELLKSCDLILVEVSPHLSNIQAKNLCHQFKNITDSSSLFYKEGRAFEDIPVKWSRRIEDIPECFTILIAHEFFDALPIHKFQKTVNGYREILIDIGDNENNFRYIIAKSETPASKMFIKSSEHREHVEVSPESLVTMKVIADRLESFGGIALIADYGHTGDGTDTFRAFKKHKLHDPLLLPGTADLTADVDFGRLKEVASEGDKVLIFGPVNQKDFLYRMGIEQRYKMLERSASKSQVEALNFSYNMMMNDDQMGKKFKFMSLMPAVLKNILDKFPAVGFS